MPTTFEFAQPLYGAFEGTTVTDWFADQDPSMTVTDFTDHPGQPWTVEVAEDISEEDKDAVLAKLAQWPLPA